MPVIKIDDAMTDEAVKIAAKKIAVVATIKTTLNPTISQLTKKMEIARKRLELVPILCSEAYKALIDDGEPQKHDSILCKAIEEVIQSVDAVVLAQASMSRLLPQLKRFSNKPILASPESGVARAINRLKELKAL